ncbi:PH domain-containing protein [Erwinia tracheiphila]|uniref:PH domain-containing protein n=1 Tax=Erwinia tracheiphila TaxID=65700 RepID=UPI00033AF2D7|nr:PH domain-containing protein [Erwinia tracheiphila]EOS94812.1 phage protein [Erwinia tracheiphila PSU-1]UIA87297.1 PH domain-containing protein [Erwinia tracheiphila]UIA95660.1 PH domain-containing protein [Erwinia tracheiphila]
MVEYKKCDKKQLRSEMERLSNTTKYKPTLGVFDIFSKLPEYLSDNEHPLCVNGGLVKKNIWLIIPTNFRLILIHKKPGFLYKKIDILSLNYENITSIDSSSGLSGGEIVINTPHTA